MSQYQREYFDDICGEAEQVSEEDQLYREEQARAAFYQECDRLAYEADMAAFLEDHGPWSTEEEIAEYEAAYGECSEAA